MWRFTWSRGRCCRHAAMRSAPWRPLLARRAWPLLSLARRCPPSATLCTLIRTHVKKNSQDCAWKASPLLESALETSELVSQGHAGTVPMKLRQDAAAAAAETVVWIEQHCGGGAGGDEKTADAAEAVTDDSLVCTTGSMVLWPGASNVIAGAANFSVDIRCGSCITRPAFLLKLVVHGRV